MIITDNVTETIAKCTTENAVELELVRTISGDSHNDVNYTLTITDLEADGKKTVVPCSDFIDGAKRFSEAVYGCII